MAESKNKVIIHFEAKDKNLVNHLKKLDKISKQLTATQKKITNVEKKKTQSTNKYENAVNKLRIQLQLEKKDLKDVKGALDLKTQALRGDELALAKLRRSTKKYIQDLKRQKKGILDTAHGQRILGGSFAVLRSKMLLASFAASIVGMSIGKLVRVFGEQEKAEKGLSDQLGHVNRGLLEQASALQSVTVHGDETLLEVMRFASVLGISEQSLGKTTEQAIGLSKALRVDLMMATRMLANAQVGNTEILNRYIPELRMTADETEKLTIINEKAAQGFKQARGEANTMNGVLDQTSNDIGDLVERIGAELAPVVIAMAESTRILVNSFDEARIKRWGVAIQATTAAFMLYRAWVIKARFATIGFTATLAKTGWGTIIAGAGLAVGLILEWADAFETAEDALEDFNDDLGENNKLTKQQIELIEEITKKEADKLKSINDEIAELTLQEAALLGVNALELEYIKHGDMFVETNLKKIVSLIDMRKKVKDLEDAEKDALKEEEFNRNQRQKFLDDLKKIELEIIQDQKDAHKKAVKNNETRNKEIEKQKKTHETYMKRLEEDRQSARETIFKDDLNFQMRQLDAQAEQFLNLKLSSKEELQVIKWLGEQKAQLRKEDGDKQAKIVKENQDKIKDARAIVLEDNLQFQLAELEIQRKQYEQLLTSAEDRVAIETWYQEQRRELTEKSLEENNLGYQLTLDSYDAFVKAMMDKDINFLEGRELVLNALKESLIKFIAEYVKEQIKQMLIEKAIRKAGEKASVASAQTTGAKILAAYSGAATAAATATLGGAAVAGGAAMKAVHAWLQSTAVARDGGLIGGQRHSQGGTLIEAEQGEYIMSRDAVNSIGIPMLHALNNGEFPQAKEGGIVNNALASVNNISEVAEPKQVEVNVNFNRPFILGTTSWVRDKLIPIINESVREGLA